MHRARASVHGHSMTTRPVSNSLTSCLTLWPHPFLAFNRELPKLCVKIRPDSWLVCGPQRSGPQTNQLSGRIFTHNLGNSPIDIQAVLIFWAQIHRYSLKIYLKICRKVILRQKLWCRMISYLMTCLRIYLKTVGLSVNFLKGDHKILS